MSAKAASRHLPHCSQQPRAVPAAPVESPVVQQRGLQSSLMAWTEHLLCLLLKVKSMFSLQEVFYTDQTDSVLPQINFYVINDQV